MARHEQDFARWNEEMVQRYDIDRYYEQSHALIRWVEQRRLQALHELAAAQPEDRVLEVGVGGGHVLERFAASRRTGLDLSPTMIGRARRRLGAAVPLLQADAERIPFPDASFDVVLCTEVLEHTREPLVVLRELLRVARPGGRVIVSVPNEAMIDRAKRALRSIPGVRRWLRTLADEGNEWHLHRFDLASFRTLARGTAAIDRVLGVPARWLPLRYVARVRRAQ